MLELVVEVDGRPLSRWGCDGVVCATPTGSTAYAFSRRRAGGLAGGRGDAAGADQRARAVRPAAGGRRRRPCSRSSSCRRTTGAGVLWCDGRRTIDLPPGARVEVRRGDKPVRLARLHTAPFTDRLVAKFALPVHGLARATTRPTARAATARNADWTEPVFEEIRIRGSASSRTPTLELAPGLTVADRRDRCRQDDGGHRPRPAARRPGRRGLVRRGDRAAVVEGRRLGRPAAAGRRPRRGGRRRARRRRRCCSSRAPSSAEGRSRAHVGGRSVPVGVLAELAEDLVAVHGQSDQQRLLRPAGSGRRSTGSPATRSPSRCRATRAAYERAASVVGRAGRPVTTAPGAAPGGRPAAVRPRRDRAGRAAAGRGRRAARRGAAARARRGLRARPRPPTRRSCGEDPDAAGRGRARRCWRRRRRRWSGSASHDPTLAGLGRTRLAEAELPGRRTSPASWRRTRPASTPTRPGWRRSSERRAALAGLTRKYGDTTSTRCWPGPSAARSRLAELDGDDERLEELTAERDALRRARPSSPASISRARGRRPRAASATAVDRRAGRAGHAARPGRVDRAPGGRPGRPGDGPALAFGGRRRRGRAAAAAAPGRARPGRCRRAPPAASCPG